jgi:phage protein D
MAITSGAGPHFAFLSVGGGSFPIISGTVSQQGTRKTSKFHARIAMSFPGALETLTGLGDNTAVVNVSTRGVSGALCTGEVDSVDTDWVNRTINITGRDKSWQLHSNKSSEKWQNKKGSEIVQDLAGRVGLSVNADASGLNAGKLTEQDFVKLSDNVSFGYLIHKLAEFDGARWWVDAQGVLNYASQSNPSGVYTLNYVPPTSGPIAADFMALRIRHNIQAGKSVEVTVKSWHPRDKKTYEHTATVQGNGGPLKYFYDLPNLKQDHVQQFAKSKANERARHELRLTATVPGDPTCNVGMALQLNGTGIYDQQYDMDSVHHSFGMQGHTTGITARSGKGGRSAE